MSNDTYQYKCGGVKANKKEKALLPVTVRIFCLEYLSRRSEKVDGNLQTTDFHFADFHLLLGKVEKNP